MAQNLRENGSLVLSLSGALRDGEMSLSQAPRLLKNILKGKRWKKRFVPQIGQVVEFESFEEFVTTPALEGLGLSIDMIKRVCGGDTEALDLLDQALREKAGKRPKDIHYNIMNKSKVAQGTSRAYALSKLRKTKPKLHAQVLAGKLSPNEAMIKAGFRPKTFTVPLDIEKAARAIERHFRQAGLLEELLKRLNSNSNKH